MAGFAGGIVAMGRAVGDELDGCVVDRLRRFEEYDGRLCCRLAATGQALHAMLVRTGRRHQGQRKQRDKEEEATNHDNCIT
ncbi:hypothetical protein [Pleomorphomonas oryzae]|uniref:hypothetical protein n=1 Tax=Pleomorphomonas oryzae TaxID=261934 RepID=UPI00047B2FA9|nr:hypothetical protein [Pleomorphomonas oryzae]